MANKVKRLLLNIAKVTEIFPYTKFFAVDCDGRLAHLPRFTSLFCSAKQSSGVRFRHSLRRNLWSTFAKKFPIVCFQKFPLLLQTSIFLFIVVLPAYIFAQSVPEPNGRVNDFAEVIGQEYKEKLDSLIGEIERKTSAEIAVVTVYSIAPLDEKQYARLIFDKWNIGKKGKDNGVLALLAVKERRWRIETGYGMEGILPDSLCGRIGREYMIPYFKDGKYAQGLYQAVAAIARVVAKNAGINLDSLSGVDVPVSENTGSCALSCEPIVMLLFLLFFGGILLLPILLGRRYNKNNGKDNSGLGIGAGCGCGGGGFGGGGSFGGGRSGGGGAGGGF